MITKQDFLNSLTEVMQLKTHLTGNEILCDIEEWDSMAILAIISMFELELNINLTSDDLRNIKSISDLIKLAGDNISE